MPLFLLLILDIIIWHKLIKDQAVPQDESLSEVQVVPPINTNPELDDWEIKDTFERWLKKESLKDDSLEDQLWRLGIINPQETVWANGYPLVPGDPDSLIEFQDIKNKAFIEGMYNSKLLEEGGREDMDHDWLMLKGCSDYGATQLLLQGVKPWEFEFGL